MNITIVSSKQAPRELLLLADPCENRVAEYVKSGILFVGEFDGQVIAAAVIMKDGERYEIKNIAVSPAYQHKGLGKLMLAHLIRHVKEAGGEEIFLGTGNSSLSQLAFYQKMGFRITGVIPDYFRDHEPPIYENGIRCMDMVILSYRLKSSGGDQ